MTEFRPWRERNLATCPQPSPHDQFVVVLVNGKRVTFQPLIDYEKLRSAAEQLAEEHQCPVKVLPMTCDEMMNFLGIETAPPQPIENLDRVFRVQAVKNCMDTLRTSAEPGECDVAINLLRKLGVLNG